jgi:hypothetical protein
LRQIGVTESYHPHGQAVKATVADGTAKSWESSKQDVVVRNDEIDHEPKLQTTQVTDSCEFLECGHKLMKGFSYGFG